MEFLPEITIELKHDVPSATRVPLYTLWWPCTRLPIEID